MSDLTELYNAAMPKPTAEEKPKRELKGLTPWLKSVYEIWDKAAEPTEKAIEARMIVNRQGTGR